MATQAAPPPCFQLYLELSSQLMLVFILTPGAQLKTGDGRELTRTSPSFTLQELVPPWSHSGSPKRILAHIAWHGKRIFYKHICALLKLQPHSWEQMGTSAAGR